MAEQITEYRVVPNSNPPLIEVLVVDTVTGVATWMPGSTALQFGTRSF